jgi:predicted DNA-binding transcriptional regulator AlpA
MEEDRTIQLLEEIKQLLGHTKKVMNVDDLASYTGLSKSKIYKLTQLKLIPMGNNKHIRQKFFDKEAIDKWLLGNPDLSDEHLEQKFNEQLFKNKKHSSY